MTDKVVWTDAGFVKAYKGKILENNEHFVTIQMPDGTVFHINKSKVETIRVDSDD
jgi:hypothetical protein